MRTVPATWFPVLAALALALAPLCAQAADAALKPGQEGPLSIPGGSKPCVLYIPSDYKAEKPFPLILFMHGSGDIPRTAPFRQITGGKGYIVCGLSYGGQADAGAGGIKDDAASVAEATAFIGKVRARIVQTYSVDQTRVILSGLSMGGWGVNLYGFGKDTAKLYAGFCVIAAGPMKAVQDFTPLAGLPVLFLNGANDPNLGASKDDMKRFKDSSGAIATQVVIPGEGHVPDAGKMAKPIMTWLAQVDAQAARDQSLAAVHWTLAKPAGDLDKGSDSKAVLTSWLQGLKEVQHTWTDKPVIIFISAQGQPAPDGTPDASSQVLDKAFSYPNALYAPLTARFYNCIQLDVTGVDKAQNRLVNEEAAPMVILLDKDRKIAVQLKGRSHLSDKGLADEMRRLLDKPKVDAIETLAQQVGPILKDMRASTKKLKGLQDQMAQISGARARDPDSQQQKQGELDELQKRLDKERSTYSALCDKLVAATKQE